MTALWYSELLLSSAHRYLHIPLVLIDENYKSRNVHIVHIVHMCPDVDSVDRTEYVHIVHITL
jgi:hypothetical protein